MKKEEDAASLESSINSSSSIGDKDVAGARKVC